MEIYRLQFCAVQQPTILYTYTKKKNYSPSLYKKVGNSKVIAFAIDLTSNGKSEIGLPFAVRSCRWQS